jgi:hypothetical protein
MILSRHRSVSDVGLEVQLSKGVSRKNDPRNHTNKYEMSSCNFVDRVFFHNECFAGLALLLIVFLSA